MYKALLRISGIFLRIHGALIRIRRTTITMTDVYVSHVYDFGVCIGLFCGYIRLVCKHIGGCICVYTRICVREERESEWEREPCLRTNHLPSASLPTTSPQTRLSCMYGSLADITGLFCGDAELFCENAELLGGIGKCRALWRKCRALWWNLVQNIFRIQGCRHEDVFIARLFCGYAQLFCGNIELFCGNTELLFRYRLPQRSRLHRFSYIRLVCGNTRLYLREHGFLLWIHRAISWIYIYGCRNEDVFTDPHLRYSHSFLTEIHSSFPGIYGLFVDI